MATGEEQAAGQHSYPPPRQAWYTVGVLSICATFAVLDQGILALLIQQIIVDFHLTDTQASLLLGPAFVFVYFMVGIPLSPLVDRWVRSRMVAIGIAVWSLATAACGLAGNFAQLFAARVAVGAGESVNAPASYSLISDCFPRDKLPKAIYRFQIGSAAGAGLSLLLGGVMIHIIAAVGTPALPLIGELRPWQAVMMGVGLPGLLVTLLVLTLKEPPRQAIAREVSKVPVLGALKYIWQHFAVFGPLFIGLTLGSLGNGAQAWNAPFFERTYGWGPGTYATVGGVVSLCAMLGGLWLGSAWVDRLQARGRADAPYRVIIYARVVSIGFTIAMPMMPTPQLAMVCSGVFSLGVGITAPLLSAVMLTVTPNQIRGQMMALYLFIFTVVGQGLAPVITGLATDYIFTSPADLKWSMMLLNVIFLPPALFVTWLGWRPYRREVERLSAEDAGRDSVRLDERG